MSDFENIYYMFVLMCKCVSLKLCIENMYICLVLMCKCVSLKMCVF